MVTVAAGLARAVEDAFVSGREDMDAFDEWLASLRDASCANQGRSGSLDRQIANGLSAAALAVFHCRAGGFTGEELPMLAAWMETREAAQAIGNAPGSVFESSDIMMALADLAGVIESMEDQAGWPYRTDLNSALQATAVSWPRYFDWFMREGFYDSDTYDEIEATYDTRDKLEWGLNCLTYFKFEYTGRLVDFDVDHYRAMLVEPDKRFREVVKKAKREGWHLPDPKSPKSFWWRQP